MMVVSALAVVVAAVLAVAAAGAPSWLSQAPADPDPPPASTSNASTPPALTARQAGETFLNGYVDPDGRVVRRDQGGDTVSEGQAYAMLVAAALGEEQRFRAVWSWTKQNLVRPDGLLSWHWQDGRVTDPSSASDADLDAARALVIAARVFDDDQLTIEGVQLGRAVLDQETVTTDLGRILVSGDWATRAPYSYNPSYVSPAANAVLAEASGDERWAELDRGTRAVSKVMFATADLPPDWAQAHADGRLNAMPGATGRGSEGVRYGYDATRVPLRFAESCDPEDVALAARLREPLDRFPGDPAFRDLGGAPLTTEESVVAAAAKAAALAASGDDVRAREQLSRADHLQRSTPTYYGAAWNALGRLMLTGDTLGGCPPLPS
jgi:endoglucanase